MIPGTPEPITPIIMRRLLRQQVYLAVLIGVAIWFLFSVRDILPIFLFSFILAYLLGPVVHWVSGPEEGKGLSRGTAAIVVYIVLIMIISVAVYVLYHALRDEILSYATNYAQYRNTILTNLIQQELTGNLQWLPSSAKDTLNNFIVNSDDLLASTVRNTLPGLVKTAPRFLELVAVPIVSFYFLADYQRFIDFVRRAIRPEGRGRFNALVADINASLRGYMAGQATLSLIAGIAAFLILSLNGVRPALVVGIAAVILELIPVVGPLVWALLAIVLTYIQQPGHTIVVAILVLIAHQADMHILAPRILGNHLRLHPAVVIFALLAGNALMGILGVLLAAPLAATIYIALTYLITEGALSSAAVSEGIPTMQPAMSVPPKPQPGDLNTQVTDTRKTEGVRNRQRTPTHPKQR